MFNDFKGGFGVDYIYPGDANQKALADSMSSYWAEFAWSGNPGTGRNNNNPEWVSWGTNGKTSILLDSPGDKGIRMSSEQVSNATIAQALAQDTTFTNQRERCELYVRMFWGDAFDAQVYNSLGEQGCSEYDRNSFSRF